MADCKNTLENRQIKKIQSYKTDVGHGDKKKDMARTKQTNKKIYRWIDT